MHILFGLGEPDADDFTDIYFFFKGGGGGGGETDK